MNGFKPEVQVEGRWSKNGLVFATEAEALENARNLMSRWKLVDRVRAVAVTSPPNAAWVDGQLVVR